jgi:hypothetical protein
MSLKFKQTVRRKLDVVETYHGNVCVCNICGLVIPKAMPRITSIECHKDFWGAHICAMCIQDIADDIKTSYWRKQAPGTEKEMRDIRRVERFLDRL